MQNKLSVVLLKGKNINEMSDMNRMSVHLEQILAEKEGVDLKVRQNITDALLKSVNFIVLCGYDSGLLSEFFKIIAYMESITKEDRPIVFLYEEPGQTIESNINELIRRGSELDRIDITVFDKVIDTWTYNDIIGYINVSLKRLGSSSNTTDVKSNDSSISGESAV